MCQVVYTVYIIQTPVLTIKLKILINWKDWKLCIISDTNGLNPMCHLYLETPLENGTHLSRLMRTNQSTSLIILRGSNGMIKCIMKASITQLMYFLCYSFFHKHCKSFLSLCGSERERETISLQPN